MTVTFGPGPGTLSYRAFRQEWVGCPKTRPVVVAARENGGEAVYVSWNGATEVEGWNVYSGSDVGGLKLVDTVVKKGFETRVVVPPAGVKVVQVEAVMANGECGNGTVRSDVVSVS